MTKQFSMDRDINGYNGYGLEFSDDIYEVILTQNIEQTLTVPEKINSTVNNSNKWLAIFTFEPGSMVNIALNKTATNTSSSTFVKTNSDLNPVARLVKVGDVLHFITPNLSTVVKVLFYSK